MNSRSGTLFWDLDGTLIDSVPLKGELFAKVFEDFPEERDALVAFHLEHGGLNRIEKIRRMLGEIIGKTADEADVAERVARFGQLTKRHLREAPLAPGAAHTLEQLAPAFTMHVVTAMPKDEAETILDEHGISAWFTTVSGFPTRKSDAVERTLAAIDPHPSVALIGDSTEDSSAAERAAIAFIQVRLDDAAALPMAALVLDGLEGAAPRIHGVLGTGGNPVSGILAR